MGKLVRAIISAATLVAGVLTFNPVLIAQGISLVAASIGAILFGPKSPKPQAAETTLKNATAPRVFGYGIRRVYGSYAFFGNSSSGATVDVIAYCDNRANSVDAVYLNDDQVTISGGVVASPDGEKYAGGVVFAGYNLGLSTETAHAAVVSALPGVWTNDHRGDGISSGYLIKNPVKDKKTLSTYPNGDNVQMSLVLNNQPCFDFRNVAHDIDDPDTWDETHNPVLHFLHYLVFDRGYSYDDAILPKIATWENAADICDETVSGEARYRACLLFNRTDKPSEIIAAMLETFDGWYSIDSLGQISVYAGAYYDPTVTIDASHIVEYSCQSFVEDENKYNEISVKYYSSLHDYNQVEAEPWRDEGDITSRGFVNSTGIEPQVPSHKQARRLAKIFMARQNAQYRGTITTNYSGRIAEGARFVNLEIIEAGAVIFDGVAEITELTRNLETGGVTFRWVLADANAWTWNAATEDGDPAPTGTYPAIDALTDPTITSASYSFDPGTMTAELTIDGTGPDRDDLTWFLRWRYDGGSVWNEQRYDDIASGATVQLVANLIPVNTDIEVEIAYSTGNGSVSGWSNTQSVNADTSSLPPDLPTEFVANDGTGLATIEWRNPSNANFDHVEIYRHTSAVFGSASNIASVYGGLGQYMTHDDTIAAGTYYYWVTSVSATAAESSPVGPDSAVVT